jgi:hypothetical protein
MREDRRYVEGLDRAALYIAFDLWPFSLLHAAIDTFFNSVVDEGLLRFL